MGFCLVPRAWSGGFFALGVGVYLTWCRLCLPTPANLQEKSEKIKILPEKINVTEKNALVQSGPPPFSEAWKKHESTFDVNSWALAFFQGTVALTSAYLGKPA